MYWQFIFKVFIGYSTTQLVLGATCEMIKYLVLTLGWLKYGQEGICWFNSVQALASKQENHVFEENPSHENNN